MKKMPFFTILLVVIFLNSCGGKSKFYEVNRSIHKTQTKNVSLSRHKALVAPLIADLEVSGQKISFTKSFNLAEVNLDIKDLEERTLFEATQKYSADVIIEPMYFHKGTIKTIKEVKGVNTTHSETNSSIDITVTGFPACYKNFRNATKEDVEIYESIQKSEKQKVTTNIQGTKKNIEIIPPAKPLAHILTFNHKGHFAGEYTHGLALTYSYLPKNVGFHGKISFSIISDYEFAEFSAGPIFKLNNTFSPYTGIGLGYYDDYGHDYVGYYDYYDHYDSYSSLVFVWDVGTIISLGKKAVLNLDYTSTWGDGGYRGGYMVGVGFRF